MPVSLEKIESLSKALKYVVFADLIVAVFSFVVCALLNRWFFGLGICLGLAMGQINFRYMDKGVASRTTDEVKKIAILTIGRLLIISAIIIGLVAIKAQLGFGAIAGIVGYQIVFVSTILSYTFRFRRSN